MTLGFAITFAAFGILISAILAVIIYNQMLLLNEVNKRLVLVTQEALERERITKEEYEEKLKSIQDATQPGQGVPDSPVDPLDPDETEEAGIDPHAYGVHE